MKKISYILLALISSVNINAQVSGIVYKDFNASGARDNSSTLVEPLVAGIVVNAYNAADVLVGTATTNSSGAYSFTGLTLPVRLEFVGLPNSYFPGCATDNLGIIGSNVQFISAATTTADFRIINPDNFSQNNPLVITSRNLLGTATGTTATLRASYYNAAQYNSESSSSNLGFTTNATTGTTWGIAYSRKSKILYNSAVTRNYMDYGPGGFDAIYTFTFNDPNDDATPAATLTPSTTIDLSNLGVPMGTSPRTGPVSVSSGVVTDNPLVYQNVGKIGIGDIDISSDGDTLFVVNLNEAAPSLAIINVTTPSSPALISNVAMPNPGCTNGTFRPWAVKYYEGHVYVGGVCDAGLSGGTAANLQAYVYRYDGGSTFTQILSFPLNYARGKVTFRTDGTSQPANWLPWTNTWSPSTLPLSGHDLASQPQPMLMDIEFTDDGSMVLGFGDRFVSQAGYNQRAYNVTTGSTYFAPVSAGDMIKFCNVSGSYVQEASSGSCLQTNFDNGSASVGGTSDPTAAQIAAAVKEFFDDDYYNTGSSSHGQAGHSETVTGALATLAGKNQILSSNFDPVSTTAPGGTSGLVNSSGIRTYNSTNGNYVKGWLMVEENSPGTNRKAGNMGDIEILSNPAPIEIGNRVWNDANGDGIQNPGEATFANVTVELYLDANNDGIPDGSALATVTTDANGQYIFSNQVTGEYVSGDPGFGHAKFNITQLVSKQNYIVRIGAADWNSTTGAGTGDLANFILTKPNAVGSGMTDWSDNDATLTSISGNQFAQISVTTGVLGANNHTYDFGFKNLASIGNKVWLDEGAGGGTAKNGIQDGTEPGVAGVTVTLYQNGSDGLPGTADDIVVGNTITDAYGNYLFSNLPPSTNAATSYNVGFTLPPNHQFTTQTNTQVTGTSNATNTTNASGGSTAANGSDANATTGRTGSFWLAPSENETGADAGLIFNTPPILNSLGDKVWLDLDMNGLQNGTEPGVAGVTVTLYDATGNTVIATTVTDANGNYIFDKLPANTNYVVGFTLPAGMQFTMADASGSGAPGSGTDGNDDSDVNISTGKTAVVNSGAPGTHITNVDAGIVTQPNNTASLGDRVWNDINNNGTQDAGEPGIPGVTVNLYQDANGDGVLTGAELTPYGTTVTDAFGNYIFNSLPVTGGPGDGNKWQVEFVQPSGYSNTAVPNNNSGNDATDSDIIDNATDRTGFIRLVNNERNMSVDAGFVQTSPAGSLLLGDKVWKDIDGDGQQDANEPGVAGVTVKLYQNGSDGLPGTADDVFVGTTTTDINGNYLFTNLAASTGASTNYNVEFSNLPAGFVFTSQDAGADATDSDANSSGRTSSINLTADNLTIDAGIKQGVPSGLASLGNKVWYDLNNNGIQDNGELGVSGVTATLKDGSGNDIDSDPMTAGVQPTVTVTNALGEYMFTNLPAGSYQVVFSNMPNGYSISNANQGSDDAADSDGNNSGSTIMSGTTSTTGVYVLGVGEENITVDLGIVPPANKNTLGDRVWFDVNSDGLQTMGEPGIPGVMVTLVNALGQPIDRTGALIPAGGQPVTTVTDANGNYLFTGLSDGDFGVKFSQLPAGYEFTTKETTNTAAGGSDADRASGLTPTVTLNYATGGTSRDNRSLDAGLITNTAALGNRVWEDLDGDGIQDAGEPGIPGVQVILYAADGTTVVGSTITDANGNYLFSNLTAGTYVVGVNPTTVPAGMEFTTQDNTTGPDGDGANTWTGGGDSDVNPTTGKTATVTLSTGQVNLTVDAGVRRVPTATVGNRVWDDLDGDGIQDAGEPGIPGVIATLYNSANQPIGSAVTGANGEWLITNVPFGNNYYVVFTNKPSGSFTLQDQGGGSGTGSGADSDTDSDADANGQTSTFNVNATDYNIIIDAGITLTISLPIKFLNFSVLKVNNTSDLQFEVGGSAVGSLFEVQRGVNGVQFNTISTLMGTNNTVYHTVDLSPVLTSKNYYRIKEVDPQGQISYSEVKIVNFSQLSSITVYPNPVVNYLYLNVDAVNAINKPAIIKLYNAEGKLMIENRITSLQTKEQVDVSRLTSGSYFVQILSSNKIIFSQKFTK